MTSMFAAAHGLITQKNTAHPHHPHINSDTRTDTHTDTLVIYLTLSQAFTISTKHSRAERAREALCRIGPVVIMGIFMTNLVGVSSLVHTLTLTGEKPRNLATTPFSIVNFSDEWFFHNLEAPCYLLSRFMAR